MLNDLSQIFLTFLYKNMTVSVVIIAVLLARFLLRKMPKKYSYILWSIVGIRMIFDLPFATNISVFNLFRGFAKHTSTVETMLAGSHRTNLQRSTDLLNKTDTTGAAAAHASRSTAVEAMTHTYHITDGTWNSRSPMADRCRTFRDIWYLFLCKMQITSANSSDCP